MSELDTRRGVIKTLGASIVAAFGVSQSVSAVPDVVTARDRDTKHPLCTYNDHGGVWGLTMPVNMRAAHFGRGDAIEEVLDVFKNSRRWFSRHPTSIPKAYDYENERLVESKASFRRFGWEPAHTHIWQVDSDSVAIHAHLDTDWEVNWEKVEFRDSDTWKHLADHIGGKYDQAALQVAETFASAGWGPASADFDYGVAARHIERWERWGDIGDTILYHSSAFN